jgi:hypothetical protein
MELWLEICPFRRIFVFIDVGSTYSFGKFWPAWQKNFAMVFCPWMARMSPILEQNARTDWDHPPSLKLRRKPIPAIDQHEFVRTEKVKACQSAWLTLGKSSSYSCYRSIRGQTQFGASEATIWSKRGSARNGSHSGWRRSSPYFKEPGMPAPIAKCSKAKSFSPVHA